MKNLLFLFTLLAAISLKAELIPVFDKPEINARLMIAERSLLNHTGKNHRVILPEHPLAYIHEFEEMQTPNGKTVFYRNDLVLSRNGSSVERLPELPFARLTAAVITALLLAMLIFQLSRKKLPENHLVFIPVLLRILLVLIVLCKWDCVMTAATDENGYFATMHDILNGKLHNQWHFTIGTGLFYLPFMLFAGAENVWDIMPYFNYFSALAIAPGILALGFFIMRKLNISGKRACIAMLIWAVYPFAAFHIEEWSTLNFQQFFLLPDLFTEFNRLIFYGFCINSGFNAMSDTPGLLVLMGSLLLTLSAPPKYRYSLLIGALYGFACLIRINYILWAPLFALLLYDKFKIDRRTLLTAAASSVAGFMVIFSIQLVFNTLQFGSPFTFGYILHYTNYAPIDRPAAGFTWHTFKKLTFMRYLLAANLPVFAAGTAALWSMKDRFRQQMLTLMSIPVILFFCGYSHTFCDARRFVFPAFAGLLIAFGSGDFFDGMKWQERLKITAALVCMFLFTTPFNAHWAGAPFMIGKGWILKSTQIIIPVFITVLIFACLRKKQLNCGLFVFLCALFFYAPPAVLGCGMLLLLPFLAVRQWLPEKYSNAVTAKICNAAEDVSE